MAITLNSLCVDCLLYKHNANARTLGSDEQAYAFSKAMMKLFLDAAPEDNSAIIGKRINDLYMQHYGMPKDRFQEEKKRSNTFVLERLDFVRNQIKCAEDPVLTALQYAILGNYIDFSALGKSVSFETLEQMLAKPEKFAFDSENYSSFCDDLQKAKTMLIVTDNAGEIGFDMLLAEILTEKYPHLQITFCVRGMPALNDATREDAAFFNLPFALVDSGSDIGGMALQYLGEEIKQTMSQSDIILAKGMGNTETLYGSGYPIYYAFLVKCPRFQQVFGKPHMTPMFIKEKFPNHT